MKLVTTTKSYLGDTLFEIAYETIEKFSGLNACAKIENIDVDLSDLKTDGNAFVYISNLDINGNVDLDFLKKYKRVILVAMGAKYQQLLKKIFDEEYDENLSASNLFDLEDCYIIGDNYSTKLIDKTEYGE
ncbi:MAG: hypothetical protein J6Y28_00790 [Acholeplasmatales bacterium]|nr:hypothetical protein [Acholeplasmatales bacterium]